MMTGDGLKRLAKLRQFKATDLKTFVETQFRQSMLAIESALKDVSENRYYFRCETISFTVAVNDSTLIELVDSGLKSDKQTCQIDRFTYQVKSPGYYSVWPNINRVSNPNDLAVNFDVLVNDRIGNSATILAKNFTDGLAVAFSCKIPILLKVGDLVKLQVSSTGTSGTVTVNPGMIEIEQITREG